METRLRKGRIWGALLVLMLVLMLVPGAVYAETVTLTQDNVDSYLTSSSMWDYNKVLPAGDYKLGGDINFNDSISRNGYIGIEGDATIDLNGHKLSCTKGGTASAPKVVVVVAYDGKLTLKDSSEGQKGTISGGFYGVKACGSLVMEGGNIKKLSDQSQSCAIYVIGEGLTLKGGTVEGISFAVYDGFAKQVYTMYADGGTVSGDVFVGSDTFIKRSEGATGSTNFTGSFNLSNDAVSLVRVLTQQDFTGSNPIYAHDNGFGFVMPYLPDGNYKLGGDINLPTHLLLYDDLTHTGSKVTLDLAGHTLKGNTGAAVDVRYGADLTLNDSSGDNSGKIEGNSGCILVGNASKFTMNGGTIDGTKGGVRINKDCKATINGGKINSDDSRAISVAAGDLTVNNCEITGNISGYGNVFLKGGTVSGDIKASGGEGEATLNLYADGGTVSGSLSGELIRSDVDDETVVGTATLNVIRSADATGDTNFQGSVGNLVTVQSAAAKYTVKFVTGVDGVTVENQYFLNGSNIQKVTKPADLVSVGRSFGGWYNGDTAWDFESFVKASDFDENGVLTLTAKWSAVTLYQSDFTGEGAKYKDRYGYFLPSGEYKLGENITLDDYLNLRDASYSSGSTVTLDLAGYTLENSNTSYGCVIASPNFGTFSLTLDDSSEDNSGCIKGSVEGLNIGSKGSFVMNGGTVIAERIGISKGADTAITINGGKINVPAGTYENSGNTRYTKAISLSGGTDTTINNGEITGEIRGYGNLYLKGGTIDGGVTADGSSGKSTLTLYADGGTVKGNVTGQIIYDEDYPDDLEEAVINTLKITRSADATAYTTFNGSVGENVLANNGYFVVKMVDESAATPAAAKIYNSSQSLSLTTPVRDGYEFLGWYYGENNATKWDDSTTLADAADDKGWITLTAKWKKTTLYQSDFTGDSAIFSHVTSLGANYFLPSGEYKLGEDITLDNQLVLMDYTSHKSSTVTLDLNGHILKKTGDEGSVISMVSKGAKLTLTDSSVDKTGRVECKAIGVAVSVDNAEFIMNGGTIATAKTGIAKGVSAKVTINGGKIDVPVGTYTYGVETMNKKAIDIQGYNSPGILTINGGEIAGDIGGYGLFYLKDGTINGCVVVDGRSTGIPSILLYADGGTITGNVSGRDEAALKIYRSADATAYTTFKGTVGENVEVNNGYYTVTVEETSAKTKVTTLVAADGKQKVTRPTDPTFEQHKFLGWYDGIGRKYWDFDSFITANVHLTSQFVKTHVSDQNELFAAAELAEDITVIADIELTSPLEVKREITLNLNGHKISIYNEDANVIEVEKGGKLTLTDGSADKSGKISGGYAGIKVNGGTLVMNGGTVTGQSEFGVVAGTEAVTINGGTICGAGENNVALALNGCSYDKCVIGGSAIIDGNVIGSGAFTINGGIINGGVWNVQEDTIISVYADGGVIKGNVYGKAYDVNPAIVGIHRSDNATAYTDFQGTVGDNVWAESGYYIVIFADESADPAKVSYILTDDQTNITEPTEPVRSGYNFRGWYNGETAWDFANGVIKDAVDKKGCLTLTANWSKKSGGSGTPASYSVNTDKTENGNVTLSGSIAKKGATVTVTVTPDKGYTLETLTVTDADGKEISLKKNSDGTYSFTMPGGKVNVAATFMDDNTMLNFFVDVKATDYFYDAVLWAVENGITSGVDENHFGPYEGCTRAQLVTFLWRAAGSPVVNYAMNFTDVDSDSYYAEAVRWAASLGIVTGYEADFFGCDDFITREQMAAVLYRFAKAMGYDTTQGGMAVREFPDYEDAADYAKAPLQWAVNAGIINGDDGKLNPAGTCVRAQIVTMLYRLLGK